MQVKFLPILEYPFTMLTIILLRYGTVCRTRASNFLPVMLFPLEAALVWLA